MDEQNEHEPQEEQLEPLAEADPFDALLALELPPAPAEPLPESVPANAEVVVEREPGRWSRLRRPSFRLSRRWVWVFASLGVLLVLATAGAAYATLRYSNEYDGKILPGSTIAGVDVGGMTDSEARAAVRKAMRPQLTRLLSIEWEDRTWTVTPKKLGARGNVSEVVREALEASSDASFFQKMRMRLFNDELSFERPVAITYPRKGARGFVEGLASSFNQEAKDAEIDYSSGWVDVVRERQGRKIVVDDSFRAVMTALRDGTSSTDLTVKTTEPEVTADDFDQILLVRIGENKLYLYEHGKITHTWPVATGQPAYPTPTGEYEIVEKRYMPTWVNPAPDTWGASMPASIPPGISNPLGLRALNWSSSGIRFHGTTATYSLGYNASHGCVRMANEDVIELYDLVEVGTPIISTQVAAYRPLYTTTTTYIDPTPVPPADPDTADDESAKGKDKGNGKGN